MNDREYNRERRRQFRLEQLGSNDPKCPFCNEDDPACLELHHLSGKKFGDDLIPVCRNCHRKLSDWQKDHPPILRGQPDTLECFGRLLLGIADALELLISLIRRAAEYLIEIGQGSRACQGAQP